MPRKKTAAAAADSTAPASAAIAAIACPACKSKISSDGKTLHEKSSYLEELLETDSSFDEMEKTLEKKFIERDATIADLRAKLEEKTKAAEPAPAPQKETANVGQQQKGKSWWD